MLQPFYLILMIVLTTRTLSIAFSPPWIVRCVRKLLDKIKHNCSTSFGVVVLEWINSVSLCGSGEHNALIDIIEAGTAD